MQRYAVGGGHVAGRDLVYERDGANSFFADMVAIAMPGSADAPYAHQRLTEHAQLVDRAAQDLPSEWRASASKRAASQEQRVNPNRVDGQGGYGVPPLWLMDEYLAFLRAGRTTADRCTIRDLPGGTDSINIPAVLTGTSVNVQTADAAAVTSVDLTDTVDLCTGAHARRPARRVLAAHRAAADLVRRDRVR